MNKVEFITKEQIPLYSKKNTQYKCVIITNTFFLYTIIQKEIPETWNIISYGNNINIIAKDILETIVNIDNLILRNKSNDIWYSSNFGDRGPYYSSLHKKVSILIFLKNIIKTQEINLVIFEDSELKDQFLEALGLQKLKPYNKFYKLKFYIISILKRVIGIYRHHIKKRKIRLCREKYKIDNRKYNFDVLLTVWANEKSFQSEKPFSQGTFYGNLDSLIDRNENKIAYLAQPVDWVNHFDVIIENALSSKNQILFTDELINTFHFIKSSILTLLLPFYIKKKIFLFNLNITNIVYDEIYSGLLDLRIVNAHLMGQVTKKIASDYKTPKIIITPYENQPWEKVLRRNIHSLLPKTKQASYLFWIVPDLYVNAYPSKLEITDQTTPDILLVSGQSSVVKFSTYFKSHPQNIGSFRYDTICDTINFDLQLQTIGIVTSLDIDESYELVFQALEAAIFYPNIQFLVNFHPLADQDFKNQLRQNLEETMKIIPENMEFSYKPLNELYSKFDLLIYHSSGACYDGIARHKPCLFLERSTNLNYNKLTNKNDEFAVKSSELMQKIDQLKSDNTLNSILQKQIKLFNQHISQIDEIQIKKNLIDI